MKRYNNDNQFRQKKSLGQVFLKELWPCQRIVDRLKKWRVQKVLEIGPGLGVLTHLLLDNGFKLTAVEKDTRLYDRLIDVKRTLKEATQDRFEIVNSDILKYDIEGWISPNERCAIVGNIPYNISSPILLMALNHLDRIVGAEFLVQLEFGQRVSGSPNTKSYGSLSVYTQLRSNVFMDGKVPRGCFKPPPKVDSILIGIEPKRNKIDADLLKRTEMITRSAFMQRRKKLINSLSQHIKDTPIREIPIDLNRRAEQLSPEEFLDLAQSITTPSSGE